MNHTQKSETEKEITLKQAAKKYWERSSFDPIKKIYMDESKERA